MTIFLLHMREFEKYIWICEDLDIGDPDKRGCIVLLKIYSYHLLVIIPLGISGLSHWMSMFPPSSTMIILRGGLGTIIIK